MCVLSIKVPIQNFFNDPRIYICIYTVQKFGMTLSCFSKFIMKINFAIDHKVRSELPKNMQELFIHLHTTWESLQQTYLYILLERMLKICSAVINPHG